TRSCGGRTCNGCATRGRVCPRPRPARSPWALARPALGYARSTTTLPRRTGSGNHQTRRWNRRAIWPWCQLREDQNFRDVQSLDLGEDLPQAVMREAWQGHQLSPPAVEQLPERQHARSLQEVDRADGQGQLGDSQAEHLL